MLQSIRQDKRLAGRSRTNVAWFVMAWGVLGMGMIAPSSGAEASKYKSLPQRVKDVREIRQLRTDVTAMIRSGSGAVDEAKLKRYYLEYILVEMTRTDDPNVAMRYPNWRREIVRDMSAAGSPQKQAAVRNIILGTFPKVVEDTGYSPACRYNALLIVGDINEKEQSRQGSAISPAVPSAKARELLLKVLNDATGSEAMKIGALVGLSRHNKLLAAANNVDKALLKVFEDIAAKSAPDASGTAAGLEWMKLMAVDALGDAGQATSAKILLPIAQDDHAADVLRMAALKSLGRLKYKAGDEVDQAGFVRTAGQLSLKHLSEQTAATKTYMSEHSDEIRSESQRRVVTETGGATNGATANTVPENSYVARVRQLIRYQLATAEIALTQVEPAIADAQWKTARTALAGELNAMLKQLDTTTLQPQDFYDKLAPSVGRLEAILKGMPS